MPMYRILIIQSSLPENDKNAINLITEMIDDYDKFADFCTALYADTEVITSLLLPSQLQLRHSLEAFRQGLTYAREKYGDESIAREICYCDGWGNIDSNFSNDFIGYVAASDRIVISLYFIAKLAAEFGTETIFTISHLPNYGLKAYDLIKLYAIEEAFHRYQIRFKGMIAADTMNDRQHELEREIGPVLLEAIRELKITVS